MAAIPSPDRLEASELDSPEGHAEGHAEGIRGTLADAQAGVAQAFTQLVRAHERSVYSLALRALGSRAEAEDLAQEVFLQLHLGLDRIQSPDHLTFWLRRTVAHRAIDRLRKRHRHSGAREAAGLPDSGGRFDATRLADPAAPEGQDPLLVRRLGRLVAELPIVPRLVVVLRYQEDLDPAQIARVLGLSVNTVKSHLKRSLARLRARCTDRETL